jgi:tape measure domain-containing protein
MSDKDISVSFTANAEGLKTGAAQSAVAVQAAVEKMTAAFDRMAAQTRADTQKVNESMQSLKQSSGGVANSIGSITNALRGMLAGIGVLLIVKEFVQMADSITLVNARLKLAAGSAEEYAAAQKAVYEIAQANNVGLQETATLYAKLVEPIRRVGGGTAETKAIVDAFATSLAISGASTQEASAATLQFAQAMASGKLSGDEFRSMAETSPRFMRALADGMGAPIESLKQMGSDGKLTADVVGNALIKSLSQLKQEAANIPDTVGGAFTRLKNDVLLAVDAVNTMTNTTNTFGQIISAVAETVREFTRIMKQLDESTEDATNSTRQYETILVGVSRVMEVVLLAAANLAYIFKMTALEIIGIVDQLGALATFDWSKFKNIGAMMKDDAAAARKDIDAFNAAVLGMTDRLLDARQKAREMQGKSPLDTFNDITGGNKGGSDKPTPNLKSTIAPDAGKGPGQLEQWKSELLNKQIAEKSFFDQSVQMEIDFWQQKLKLVTGSGKEQFKTRTAIEREIYNLRKTSATQDRALNEESIAQYSKMGLEQIATERSQLQQKKALRTISIEDAAKQEEQLAARELKIRTDALKERSKLYEGDKVAQARILNEVEVLKTQHLRQMQEREAQYNREALGETVTRLQRELEQFRNNMNERLLIAQQIQQEINKLYGAGSREALAAAAEVGRIERQKTEQIKNLQQESVRATEAAQLSGIDRAQQLSEFEVQMGVKRQKDAIAAELQFEAERYNIKSRALIAQEELIKGTDADPVKLAQINNQKIELEREYYSKSSELRMQYMKENNKFVLGAFSEMESGFANALGNLMKGLTTFKDFMREIVRVIVGAFINMVAQMVAQWIMGQIMQKVFGKMTAQSQISANAAVAATAAMASVAAIPYTGWAMAPGVGAATFGTAMGYQASLAAEQGFDVPAGTNPVTQLHQKEMVLPASQADVIRNMAENGGGGGGMTVNISAVDAKGVRELFMREGSALAAAMRQQQRNFGLARS